MIDNYLLSKCVDVKNSFNEKYKSIDESSLKIVASNEYSKFDFMIRLFPYFDSVRYYYKNFNNKKIDVFIKSLDYKIDVKLIKNFMSDKGNLSNSSTWKEFEDKLISIGESIINDKGKQAFVIGWFNVVDSFSNIVQLGESGGGGNPDINFEKLAYFPFLSSLGHKTQHIQYKYLEAFKELTVAPLSTSTDVVNCKFFGKPSDKFHIAIYY